jgi:LPS-assembly lipoprotein
MNRLFRASLLLCTLALSACGFHLRQSAALPPSMQRMHLTVSGGGSLQRDLARALEDSGVTIEDQGGPGIAELKIPLAAFDTDTLSVSGGARVTEYSVRYQVRFEVDDSEGEALVAQQRIDMSRDFSYDALNTVGTDAQVEELHRSLNDDMVQAILFRLQAAGRHQMAEPAAASSAG